MFVTKEFTFHASHFLTKYFGKCERLHGHSYRLSVTLEGDIASNDLVLDFGILKRIVVKHVIEKLDHHHLNDMFENPSAERVCEWIFNTLKPFPTLLREEVEDPNLAGEMKKYLQDGQVVDASDVANGVNFGVRLYEIRLWETEEASVALRAE